MTDLKSKAAEFRARRDVVRTEMGGNSKVARVHSKGRLTIRERIERLVDPDSFQEIGTFAHSEWPGAAAATPGDGKVGGIAKLAGRPIAVAGDDVTVLHGSSSVIGSKRLGRIYEQAFRDGTPYVYFGETGGARLPDTLGSAGFAKVSPDTVFAARARAVPTVTVIAGESFGGSSFKSALSDIVIQVRGTTLAVTSPRVIEIATGEKVGFEELGGVDVHDRITGQLDRIAETEDEAIQMVKEVLDYLPQNAFEEPARKPWDGKFERDEHIYDLVPLQRTRGYDVRRVIRRLTDDGRQFELKPNFGRGLVTSLGRVAGRTVGFLASQPMHGAGALTPQACDKATSFTCLCDAFNIPLIFLQDVPGFMVGKQVEHDRILSRAIMFLEALSLCRVPRLSIVMRKAFGLAYFSLAGNDTGSAQVAAWPNAEISFMDPAVGVNVVHSEKLRRADDPEAERQRLIEEWSLDTGPDGAAGSMAVDEIIDPAETRAWLRRHVDRFRLEPGTRDRPKPLAYWPTCY